MARRRNDFSKTLKDYLVPIIGLILIIILALNIFGGDSTNIEPNTNNGIGLDVTLDGPNTEAVIVYEGDYKTPIDQSAKLFKGEKVLVKSGAAHIALDEIGDFKLDKLGELKYNIAGDFTLFSSNLWLNSKSPVTLNLQFGGSVQVGANSTVSISQNDVQATLYLLSGTATFYAGDDKEISLARGEQLTYSRKDSLDTDLDLSLLKDEFGQFFKVSDWYIKNNGDFFLNQSEGVSLQGEESSVATGTLSSNTSGMILTSVFDESSVTASPIKLEGRYDAVDIDRITINGIQAVLDDSSSTFKIEKFELTDKVNDLVIKAYDDNQNIVTKEVYTVYYPNGSTSTVSAKKDTTIYDVDATQFGFTAPSTSGKFATTGSEITIRGITTASGIEKVTVDGFELASFNGSTWRYHAFKRFDNLQEGTNQYEIKYFDASGKVVYTDYYTIVKRQPGDPVKEVELISDEA